jgi:hypothetical protein
MPPSVADCTPWKPSFASNGRRGPAPTARSRRGERARADRYSGFMISVKHRATGAQHDETAYKARTSSRVAND